MTALPTKLPTAEHLKAYTRRKAIVDGFASWKGTQKDYAAQHGVSSSTVNRLVRLAAMGSDRLLDRRMLGGRKVALPSKIAAMLFCFWVDHPSAHLTEIHREVSKLADQAGLRSFSYKQVKSLFSRVPEDMRKIIAAGQRAGFEQAGLVARRVEDFPNGAWQMDATEMDQWALCPIDLIWYKPWMTSIIDCSSRVMMAAMFHRHEPTTADALITLRAAILSKGCTDYPFYGTPNGISCDNHSTYESADFLDALRRLGITKIDIPNAAPSANGKVERFFHTFKFGLLAKLAGYAGQYRGLAKAKEGAVPGALLPKIIRKFLTEYHLREHRGISTTPWEKWHENIEHAHGLIVNEADVSEAIRLRRKYQVHRDGIEVEPNRHFTDSCLSGLVGEEVTLLVSPEGRDLEIPAYYNDNHIGTLRCVEEDATLADDIRAERLARSVDIARLGKNLRGLIEPVEQQTGEPASGGQSQPQPRIDVGPIITAPNGAQPLKAPAEIRAVEPMPDYPLPLGVIPKFKADEKP